MKKNKRFMSRNLYEARVYWCIRWRGCFYCIHAPHSSLSIFMHQHLRGCGEIVPCDDGLGSP